MIIIYIQHLILSKFEVLKGFQCEIMNLAVTDNIQHEQMEINHKAAGLFFEDYPKQAFSFKL